MDGRRTGGRIVAATARGKHYRLLLGAAAAAAAGARRRHSIHTQAVVYDVCIYPRGRAGCRDLEIRFDSRDRPGVGRGGRAG